MLPEVWKSVVGRTIVRFVGVTRRRNEIVLYSSSFQNLVYYNTERNTVVRVDIQGMEAFGLSNLHFARSYRGREAYESVEDFKSLCKCFDLLFFRDYSLGIVIFISIICLC